MNFTIIFSSLHRNKKGIAFIIAAAGMLALGQLIWKIGGYNNFTLIMGFLLYAVGAIFMIIGYRYGILTVLHPFMSVSYVFAFIFGTFFLSEIITIEKIIGLSLIILGVFLIGSGDAS